MTTLLVVQNSFMETDVVRNVASSPLPQVTSFVLWPTNYPSTGRLSAVACRKVGQHQRSSATPVTDDSLAGARINRRVLRRQFPEMNSEPPTGWSAPSSQVSSLNSSDTSPSGILPVQRPTKIQRSVPAAAAITAMSYDQPTVVSSTSSSDIISVASTSMPRR